jgi:hypothetical protein
VYRLWEANPWREVPEPNLASITNQELVHFTTSSNLRIVRLEPYRTNDRHGFMTFWRDVRIGQLDDTENQYGECLFGGALYVRDGARFFDGETLARLIPEAGRNYPAALKRFARDGRFVLIPGRVIDMATDKSFEIGSDWDIGQAPGHIPGFGTPVTSKSDVRVFPDVRNLGIEAGVLQLWAQVAVRGELDVGGQFKKWDHATWEKKRQELAAVKPPFPDFPFPGYVATDKLHWLRAEYGEAKTDAAKLDIAKELLRRAESARDTHETDHWRAVIADQKKDPAEKK